MRTELFDYDLPEKFIAQHPPKERGTTRLMVLDRAEKSIEHKRYSDIPEFINDGDVIVLNKTKVIQARVFAKVERTGREVEILFLEELGENLWHALIGRARHVKIGDTLHVGDYRLAVQGRDKGDPGFKLKIHSAKELMKKHGHTPLPPYIKRPDTLDDKSRYNTVFSEKDGSVAAPTASLNLTEELLQKIQDAGGQICHINLVVGWGTFAPVNTEKIEDFKIHGEYVDVPAETVETVNLCKGNIWVFGTTVVRALESAAIKNGELEEFHGQTELFIYPGYKYKIVDRLVTNFHAPRTSLIMLVSAFAGREFTMKAYETAKEKDYKFLSYGDSMLIL